MRFKIFTGGFMAHVFVMLPITLGWMVLVVYQTFIQNSLDWLLVLVLIFPYYLFLVFHRKDYFSVITMTNFGISASFLGKSWFNATWSELKYVGRFKRTLTRGGITFDWICFSKISVTIGKNIRFEAPNNASLQGDGFFMELYKKEALAEVYKHIPKENVVWEGTFIRSKKE